MTESAFWLLIMALGLLASAGLLSAQTYYYERIKTVTDGRSVEDTGDGHFITFNSKGCYDSDKNGMAEKIVFRKYISFENDIYKYYGDTWEKEKAYYFFSSDKSRLNIRLEGKDIVYVYVKKTAPSGMTAQMRGYRPPRESSPSGSSSSTVYIPIVPPITPNYGGGTYGGGGTAPSGPTKRICPSCGGTGKGWDEIVYSPNYTGTDNSRYCPECGCVSPAHTHIHHKCATCHGKCNVDY